MAETVHKNTCTENIILYKLVRSTTVLLSPKGSLDSIPHGKHLELGR